MDATIPNIRSVRPGKGRKLVVQWKGGAESVIDVGQHLAAYAVFKPLRASNAAFHKVAVGDWGWSAHWSDEMEISSDTLWRLALEQGSSWLRKWREEHRMTQSEAAAALGVSPRMWRYYEAGTHLLPKTVGLACIGLDAQVKAA
jgi:DNA-binding transcriptional regulator YiaG